MTARIKDECLKNGNRFPRWSQQYGSFITVYDSRLKKDETKTDAMACQSNPETCAIVIRLPIEEGAALKSLADSEGLAVSAFVAGMVHEMVKGHKLT